MYDVCLTDFPRLSGETDDSIRINRAINAAPNGILYIPKGEYDIYSPVKITNRCSLLMHPAAHLCAKREMDFVVSYDGGGNFTELTLFNDDNSVYDNLGIFIKGGDIDGNKMASCLHITNAHHFTLSDTVCHNGKTYGLCIGKGGMIYEIVCNNVYCKCNQKGLWGNIGIYTDKCDGHFTDCFVIDYTTGIRLDGGANRLTRCHVWGGTVSPEGVGMDRWSHLYYERKTKFYGDTVYQKTAHTEGFSQFGVPEMLVNSVSFDLRGGHNVADGCYADTAAVGYKISGDSVITNSGFFNNELMGLRESTAVKHEWGNVRINNCDFRATVGTEKLYDGIGENIRWDNNFVDGFDVNSIPDFAK